MLLSQREHQTAADHERESASPHLFSRRVFLQRAAGTGLSLSTLGCFLSACNNVEASSSVDILNVWSGEEQASFMEVVKPFKKATGIEVTLNVTRYISDALSRDFANANPPDIAILPNPGYMQELAAQHHLIALDSFLDMEQIRKDYAQTWLDLGSYQGRLYALFYKTANKGTIWYSPQQFQEHGYQLPQTWAELLSLSNQIARQGAYPWAMGIASGGSSGWPGADWIAEIYLNQFGPQMYDQWWQHRIPWTHESLRQAFQIFGQIVAGKHYIAGAPTSILNTDYSVACSEPFTRPPQAYMNYLGDFAPGFITSQLPGIQAGTDFNFFPFPTLNPAYAGAVTGGADVVVALRDTTAVRQLIQYMATAAAQEIWVKRGGFTSPNKSVPLSSYPDPVARASAKMLTQAPIYRFGADDLMPSPVEQAFWMGIQAFILKPGQLDSILQTIELTAQKAY